ncbi:ATP-binding cassette domain-containing protein [Alteromonas sp.]|uniref:ATP-dependent nuclease n=1 Tax=Alteromonas sp. TaxID=232 RepID=UPI000B75B19D|nr:ATP-binding cassette domain-containing protein [Alteromonas sp.]MAI38978.1 spermidine/putrescine ABC transporter ATP-binding protein [Alteromonas sp.]OUX84760.1 MAG: hypothetical protein CBB95_15330 [Alteromonas sp. TMED35]|tara:strand:+ start:965 stop:2320 length:1356 start_codon:yes stop_codon:yes gene_type:complete
MLLSVEIENVQHIQHCSFEVDLSLNQLQCLVGKNGCGKTTLVRAIRNLSINDTFQQTGAPYIFDESSNISYQVGDKAYSFVFNKKLKAIDSKQLIDKNIRQLFGVELPIPHGKRFSHFQELVKYDSDIRSKMANGDFEEPEELIQFLNRVYGDDRFNSLKKVSIKNNTFYAILRDPVERFYIREDYLSSGEYFLINLYRYIQEKRKCIVIDEIDIALDASAQVKLIEELRRLCELYEVNVIFTTHSLALMETLHEGELHYMENSEGKVSTREISHNYAKSILFGFHKNWDRYILTEDELSANFIKYLIRKTGEHIFSKYIVIHFGGAQNTVDIRNRNEAQEFFSCPENVLCALDGDQLNVGNLANLKNVVFLPYQDLEHELGLYWDARHHEIFDEGLNVRGNSPKKRGKSLLKQYAHKKLKTEFEVFEFLINNSPDGIDEYQAKLIEFLSR